MEELFGFRPRRVIVFAIGGGGDVASAALNAAWLEARGVDAVLAAIPWERLSVDGCPGPLHPGEIIGASPVGAAWEARPGCVALRSCNLRVFAPQVCRVASILGRSVYLVDAWRGAAGVAEALADIASLTGAEAVLAVDVGGDVLAEGLEESLWSPLADSIGLAASASTGLPAVVAVHSPGADGELPLGYILERLGDVAAAGGLRGARMVTGRELLLLEELLRGGLVTEAGLAQLLAARGARGVFSLRGGTRRVDLTVLQALVFYLDARVLHRLSPLSRRVEGTRSLEEARRRLNEACVYTELDLEEDLWHDILAAGRADPAAVRARGRRRLLASCLERDDEEPRLDRSQLLGGAREPNHALPRQEPR